MKTAVEVTGHSGQATIVSLHERPYVNQRYHAGNLRIEVGDPDKKGKRMVQLTPRTKGVGCALGISTEDWAIAAPLLERVQTAAAEQGTGRRS